MVLIFLSLFLSIACNNNSTTNNPAIRNYPFDNKAYFKITHQEDQSILRQKLLNLSLTNLLNKASQLSDVEKIKQGDEFRFSTGKFKSPRFDLLEYNKMKSIAAEVIVSYSNRLEIYFVPVGIERNNALNQLALNTEPGESLSWIDSTDYTLLKNKVYYLLSSNKAQLLNNDIHFNSQKIIIEESFNQKTFNFSKNQVMEIELNINYLVKETSLQGFNGTKRKCTRDMQEAGLCEECTYKMETLTGRFIKKSLENIDLVDLDIFINEKKYNLNDLNPIKDTNGHFKIILDLKQLVDTSLVNIQILQNIQNPVLKMVKATDVASMCAAQNMNNIIDVTPSVKINFEMKVLGRYFIN